MSRSTSQLITPDNTVRPRKKAPRYSSKGLRRLNHGDTTGVLELVREHRRRLAISALIVVSLAWSYWQSISDLVVFWISNQDYSIGMLVPPVAIYLVWRRREALARLPVRACAAGFGILIVAEVFRYLGLYFGIGSADRYALVFCLIGMVVLIFGRSIAWNLRWVLVFLFLMVPLPARIHEMVALPLQEAATSATVFGLEVLGFFVVREGNVLRLDESTTVAVTEACSGLRMMTSFVFIAALLAFLIDRPKWQRVVLLLLSIPIAVASNALRGVVTASLMYYSESELARQGIHDIAGWAMMPLALIMSIGILKLMSVLAPPQTSGAAA